MIDVAVIVSGCFFGVLFVAIYGESVIGMKEGGRIGLIVIIIGIYFLLLLFFVFLLISVLLWVIGFLLVMIGVIMMKVVKDIDWGNVKEVVFVFVIIILMLLIVLIFNGIVGGIGVYVVFYLYDYGFWFIK